MRKKPKKRSVKKRNPIAKAVRGLRPKVVPDRRRKKLEQAREKEAEADKNE